MAWGFWTTYNVHVESRRSRQFTNPAVIRERSWERLEMRTYGKIEQASSDRIAYERHLLLGDRDWSEKTVADRNTLPRKKNPSDFEKTSTPSPPPFNISTIDNSVFKGGEDSESKKSEDLFCPACHRESRVSFGSITSSRESSHGRTKSEDDSIIASVNNNANSEVKLDEVAQGLHSSSLPTPPPPPPIFTPHPINAFNLKTTTLSTFKSNHPINKNESYSSKSRNINSGVDFFSQEDLVHRSSSKEDIIKTSTSTKRMHRRHHRASKESIRSRQEDDNRLGASKTLLRPRSVSLGNRLLDTSEYERHNTIGQKQRTKGATGEVYTQANQNHIVSVRSSHSLVETSSRSVSSRSGKSSSSRSPSNEKLKEYRRPGCGSSKCKKYTDKNI